MASNGCRAMAAATSARLNARARGRAERRRADGRDHRTRDRHGRGNAMAGTSNGRRMIDAPIGRDAEPPAGRGIATPRRSAARHAAPSAARAPASAERGGMERRHDFPAWYSWPCWSVPAGPASGPGRKASSISTRCSARATRWRQRSATAGRDRPTATGAGQLPTRPPTAAGRRPSSRPTSGSQAQRRAAADLPRRRAGRRWRCSRPPATARPKSGSAATPTPQAPQDATGWPRSIRRALPAASRCCSKLRDGKTGAVPFSGTVEWSKGVDENGPADAGRQGQHSGAQSLGAGADPQELRSEPAGQPSDGDQLHGLRQLHRRLDRGPAGRAAEERGTGAGHAAGRRFGAGGGKLVPLRAERVAGGRRRRTRTC